MTVTSCPLGTTTGFLLLSYNKFEIDIFIRFKYTVLHVIGHRACILSFYIGLAELVAGWGRCCCRRCWGRGRLRCWALESVLLSAPAGVGVADGFGVGPGWGLLLASVLGLGRGCCWLRC